MTWFMAGDPSEQQALFLRGDVCGYVWAWEDGRDEPERSKQSRPLPPPGGSPTELTPALARGVRLRGTGGRGMHHKWIPVEENETRRTLALDWRHCGQAWAT